MAIAKSLWKTQKDSFGMRMIHAEIECCHCLKILPSFNFYISNIKYCKKCVIDRNKTNRDHNNHIRTERRHRNGVSKRYRSEISPGMYLRTGISYTPEYKRLQRKRNKALRKYGGELLIETLQAVYEDNIKKYGTLTCYLCLQHINFCQDSLEHKIPLSRGGDNGKDNLGISCLSCNKRKHTKTVEEFLIALQKGK